MFPKMGLFSLPSSVAFSVGAKKKKKKKKSKKENLSLA
jgi:hypothetical protein